ncbi:hypothetical protein BZA70DRAFT_279259 [Myxozyma melibiosi]|uniref:Integrase zinc-binding domain-containing protein n=1 Tax=Myxozyma melibiosi TaxID=54550 RepID=A0ABR1F5T5_9ASCO
MSVFSLDALYDATSGAFIGFNGLPTVAQCSSVVSAYIATLSDVKKQKSLIPRQMYDDMLAALTDPHSQVGSPQFRFWARANFAVFRDHDALLHLMHKSKPVAVQEELYGILAICHLAASHGGRDKTLAQLREWYTRVPKNLISQYVKLCPTCAPESVSLESHPELIPGDKCYLAAAGLVDVCKCVKMSDSSARCGSCCNLFSFRQSVVRYRIKASVQPFVRRAEQAAQQAQSQSLLANTICASKSVKAEECSNAALFRHGLQPLFDTSNTLVVRKQDLEVDDCDPALRRTSRRSSIGRQFGFAVTKASVFLSSSTSTVPEDAAEIKRVLKSEGEVEVHAQEVEVCLRSDAGLTEEVSLIMRERAAKDILEEAAEAEAETETADRDCENDTPKITKEWKYEADYVQQSIGEARDHYRETAAQRSGL